MISVCYVSAAPLHHRRLLVNNVARYLPGSFNLYIAGIRKEREEGGGRSVVKVPYILIINFQLGMWENFVLKLSLKYSKCKYTKCLIRGFNLATFNCCQKIWLWKRFFKTIAIICSLPTSLNVVAFWKIRIHGPNFLPQ